MRSLNRVFLIGHLGHAPELQHSKSGRPFTRLSLATDRFRPNLSDEERENAKPDWHSVFVWGDQAERCVKYLRQGAMVFVEGELTYWQVAQDSGKQYKNAIQGNHVRFITYGRPAEDAIHAANLDIPEDGRNHNAVAHPLM